MNIDNLKLAKSILEDELSNNLKANNPNGQTDICFIIDRLRSLIDIESNPMKHKKINKLCNPDEK